MGAGHEDFCQPTCKFEDRIESGVEAYRGLYINGHPNGSIMVRMSKVEEMSETNEEVMREIKKSIDDLPKKLVIWLTILTLLIAIFQFLTPSIKKSMGMARIEGPTLSQETALPPSFERR